ncbi:MAG: CGNR zinc finger domain-containing protein [Capsulimonadales bacterium]|nr:CGNR zinc finger domain-containing protein [Capsulimonadales bacterium]
MENGSLFVWVGGLPGIDWVNTEVVRHGRPTDLIVTGNDLLTWLQEADLLQAGERERIRAVWDRSPEQEFATLTAARAFRAVLRRTLDEILRTGRVADASMEAINERLRLRTGSYQLRATEQGGHISQFVEQSSCTTTECLLGRLAQTAEALLCQADLTLIRRCENPNCVLYFYDTTKNHTRRWCSMTACGNRAKAAAHYLRKKAAEASSAAV